MLRRLFLFEGQFLDHLLAHDKFLHLAGHRHREVIDEFDVAGDLKMRDLSLAEFADFLRRRGFTFFQADPGAQLLAIFGIGHANHLDVGNFGMGVQEFLNLAGINVFAAADHHVLDAADDIALSGLVDGGQIAHFKVPRYVKFVPAFPMTVTGKVQKFVMREETIRELGLDEAETA